MRSDAKAKEVLDLHPTWKDQLSFVTVPSFVVEKAWDHVFQNEGVRFDYIIHTASPVNFGAKDFQKDLIDPAIRGYAVSKPGMLLPDANHLQKKGPLV